MVTNDSLKKLTMQIKENTKITFRRFVINASQTYHVSNLKIILADHASSNLVMSYGFPLSNLSV